MNTYIQIRSILTDEKLIISDEFETNTEATSYRDLLLTHLIHRIRSESFENLSSWLEKSFVVEVIEVESHPDIFTKEIDEALTSIHEDVERVIDYMDHTFSEVETPVPLSLA